MEVVQHDQSSIALTPLTLYLRSSTFHVHAWTNLQQGSYRRAILLHPCSNVHTLLSTRNLWVHRNFGYTEKSKLAIQSSVIGYEGKILDLEGGVEAIIVNDLPEIRETEVNGVNFGKQEGEN